ncbi:MAG TPA: preprotein translocase subunit YajC [Clostridia bacterium]|jgi:preprotein translocase subunit YajC|nr:preprotein translocase subunit YajC [Clostridia bacterium]
MDTSGFFLYLLLFIGIFYFLLYRPQQKHKKQRQELMDSLRVGKDIVTIGGIHGEIVRINKDTVILKIAENVEIEIQKTAVGFIKDEELDDDDDEDDYDEKEDYDEEDISSDTEEK